MKKLLLANSALLALMAGPATAADMPANAPLYRPPPPPAIFEPWTGFYVGISAGYNTATWPSTSAASVFPSDTSFLTTDSPNTPGWQAGGHAGFNWLIDGSWLLGVEADIQATGQQANSNGRFTTTTPTLGGFFNTVTTQTSSNQWKLPWFGTLRGRIGGLAAPDTLIYVTGGLAAGQFTFSSQTTVTTQLFDATGTIPLAPSVTSVGPSLSEGAVRLGAAAGIGVEQKFLGNWSGRLEYLYLDFGSFTFLSGTGVDTKVQLRDNIFRMGVSYTFKP